MSKNLRQRFIRWCHSRWSCYNTYDKNWRDLGEFPAIYFFVSLNCTTSTTDIVYVGSTTNLKQRYLIHKIPNKIRKSNAASILFFKEMKKGFYDFERRLIKKLDPIYNVQHKKR